MTDSPFAPGFGRSPTGRSPQAPETQDINPHRAHKKQEVPAGAMDFNRAEARMLQNLTLQDVAELTERHPIYKKLSIGPNLKAWRVSKGMSQFQAAVHTGVSLSTWIRWETKGVPPLRRERVREMLTNRD